MHKVMWLTLACSLLTVAQTASPTGTPAKIVVTLGHSYGPETPVLTRDSLTITQHYEPLQITDLIPLQDAHAALELYFLVDNCSSCEPGTKFEDLRRFIVSQPATTAIGVAYIRNGHLEVAEKPTQDRKRAAEALNTPEGDKPTNPYDALTELIQSWGQNSSRRAVLMITNGFNPNAPATGTDPSVEAAIAAAQRARVTVYAMYHPSADYLSNDLSKLYDGQVELAHLAVETGGEAYFISFGPLPSLAPFLADLSDHLANQYLLQFLANPGAGSGALEEVLVKSKVRDIELMVPNRTWIPGRAPAEGPSKNTGKGQ